MSKVQKISRDETTIIKHVQIKHLVFWFLFGDFYILNIFYKIQNLNKWQLVSVITYTCLNPWALSNTFPQEGQLKPKTLPTSPPKCLWRFELKNPAPGLAVVNKVQPTLYTLHFTAVNSVQPTLFGSEQCKAQTLQQ